jgi:hypothetical protein
MQRQAATGEQAVDHLAHIQGALGEIQKLAEEQARGQDNTNMLLQRIHQVLTETTQHGSAILRSWSTSRVSWPFPERVCFPSLLHCPGLMAAMSPPYLPRSRFSSCCVKSIDSSPVETVTSVPKRSLLWKHVIARHSSEGLLPSGVPIVVPLKDVYVELKAVADVPEAADTYSAEERRLLYEAEEQGTRVREDMAMHLDALRAERWKQQARQTVERLQRRSIEELWTTSLSRPEILLAG